MGARSLENDKKRVLITKWLNSLHPERSGADAARVGKQHRLREAATRSLYARTSKMTFSEVSYGQHRVDRYGHVLFPPNPETSQWLESAIPMYVARTKTEAYIGFSTRIHVLISTLSRSHAKISPMWNLGAVRDNFLLCFDSIHLLYSWNC